MTRWFFRRRRILIHGLQYRLLIFNLFYFLTILLFVAFALFVPLIIQMEIGTAYLSETQQAASHFLFIGRWLWPGLLTAFVLLAIHSVVVSHRIAGPLYRFRIIFKKIAEGNLTARVTLRKNDYIESEAESINEMIVALGIKIKQIQEQYEEVNTMLAKCKITADAGTPKEVSQNIEGLEEQMRRLRVCLEQFKIAAEETSHL